MAGIWQYPNLDELENFISQLTLQAADNIADKGIPESAFVNNLSLAKVLIIGEWGEGTANFGEDELQTVLFFNFDAPESEFDTTVDVLTEEMSRIIDQGEIIIPSELMQNTTNIVFFAEDIESLETELFNMQVAGLESAYDLTQRQLIRFIEGRPASEYQRIPHSELVEDTDEEEEVEEEEPTGEVPSLDRTELVPLPDDMLIDVEEAGPDFPEINPYLRPFATDPDTLEIPAGKEEKQIEPREPYDFEEEMAIPGIQDYDIVFDVIEEIAEPVGAGTLSESEPAGTYPRTGVYIRNYLKFHGPAYSYEIYKNLVFYSGYISSLHDINVRAGDYSSFREYMYVLEEIPRRGGPELVEKMSQQQAAAQGLEVIPDHPSIDGAKAPWLEARQYYRLVEENDEHDAWLNAYDYLHSELDEE